MFLIIFKSELLVVWTINSGDESKSKIKSEKRERHTLFWSPSFIKKFNFPLTGRTHIV